MFFQDFKKEHGMITRYALLFASFTFFSLHSAAFQSTRQHQPVLPSASFFIQEATLGSDGYPLESYYNGKGDYLGTYNYGAYQLDPQAPKPQITNCEFVPERDNKPCRIFFTVGHSAQRIVFNYNTKTGKITDPQNPSRMVEFKVQQSLSSIAEWLGVDMSQIDSNKEQSFRSAVWKYKKGKKQEGQSQCSIM